MVSCFSRSLWRDRREVGGQSGSSWWREVDRICDGEGVTSDGWFENSVLRRVGDGAETLFWTHRWIGGAPLSVSFHRLFALAENKMIIVANICWNKGVSQVTY